MRERLDYAWRVLATGVCFTVFGGAGLYLGLVFFPLVILSTRDRQARIVKSRALVKRFFGFFIRLMTRVGVISYEVHGAERLQRPGQLVLANHPTLIDVIFLISLIPQADCVVKAALARNPFTKGPLKAADYISNDEGLALIDDCRRSLDGGSTVVIFPEGTRTPRQGPMVLQRGAANVAIRCRRPVTPVVITVDPLTLGKGEKWYKIPPRRAHFVIRVHDELQVEPFLEKGDAEPLAVRRLNAQLKSFFEQESGRAAA